MMTCQDCPSNQAVLVAVSQRSVRQDRRNWGARGIPTYRLCLSCFARRNGRKQKRSWVAVSREPLRCGPRFYPKSETTP